MIAWRCRFSVVVVALVINEIASIPMKVTGYPVQGKVDPEIRIGKEVIHCDHTEQRSDDHEQITGSVQHGQNQSERIDDSNICYIFVAEIEKTKRDGSCYSKHQYGKCNLGNKSFVHSHMIIRARQKAARSGMYEMFERDGDYTGSPFLYLRITF